MEGDPFKNLQPGDPLPTSVKTWNPLLELARKSTPNLAPSSPPIERANSQTIVTVKNVGPFDLERFAPFMIQGTSLIDSSAPAWGITPSLNPDAVNRPVLWGREHLGNQRRHAVTLEPIKAGTFGRAVISGAVPCRVWSETETAPTHAEPFFDDAVNRHRMLGTFCGYPILAREKGTGEKWALVLLGQKTPARAHFWRQYQIGAPVYSATFTGASHDLPNPLWHSNFIGRTNAPHIFEKRHEGVFFKNRDPRYWRAWAKFRVSIATSNQNYAYLNIFMMLNTVGIVAQTSYCITGLVGHGNNNAAHTTMGECSHGMIFEAYKTAGGAQSHLTLTGKFTTTQINPANVTGEIKDVEIWIEEVDDSYTLKTMVTTPAVGNGNIEGFAVQSRTTALSSTGTGTGTVTAEVPT